MSYVTDGKDFVSLTKGFLEKEKDKETKLIIELKDDNGRTERKELTIGKQAGILEVFGNNWNFGVR